MRSGYCSPARPRRWTCPDATRCPAHWTCAAGDDAGLSGDEPLLIDRIDAEYRQVLHRDGPADGRVEAAINERDGRRGGGGPAAAAVAEVDERVRRHAELAQRQAEVGRVAGRASASAWPPPRRRPARWPSLPSSCGRPSRSRRPRAPAAATRRWPTVNAGSWWPTTCAAPRSSSGCGPSSPPPRRRKPPPAKWPKWLAAAAAESATALNAAQQRSMRRAGCVEAVSPVSRRSGSAAPGRASIDGGRTRRAWRSTFRDHADR